MHIIEGDILDEGKSEAGSTSEKAAHLGRMGKLRNIAEGFVKIDEYRQGKLCIETY